MKPKKIGLAPRVLPNLTVILSTICLVLFVIDQWFNRNMAFLANPITKWMLAALSVLSIATSVMLIARNWDADDEAAAARKAERKTSLETARHKTGPHALSRTETPENARGEDE